MSDYKRARIFLITDLYFKNRTQFGLLGTQWDINHKLKSYNFVPCITETFFLVAFHLLGHIHWQTQKLKPRFHNIKNSTIGNSVAFILIISIIGFHPQTQVETALKCNIVNSTSRSTAAWVLHLNGHTLGFSPRTQMLQRTFSCAQVLFDCSSAKVKVTLIVVGSFFLEKQGGVAGADPAFFSGGGALVSCSTSTPINHIFFFGRTPVVLENRRSSQGGGGCSP